MKRKTQRTYPLTAHDARGFQQAADVLDGAWGAGPQRYLRGWLRLWMRYDRLKKAGVNVRISPPELGWRGPFLIIERTRPHDRRRHI